MSVRRRIAVSAAAFALAGSFTVALPTAASADQGGNAALQYCRSIAQYYPGNITGPCVSFYQSHDSNAAATTVYFCKMFLVPNGVFATVGECVSTLNGS